MLINDLLQQAVTLLADAGCPSPHIDAEHLLCHALHLSRIDLYLTRSRPLTPEEIRGCEAVLHLRVSRLPLQYILGETEFMSLPFSVDPSVLIPRPETEILVEAVINCLQHPTGLFSFHYEGAGCHRRPIESGGDSCDRLPTLQPEPPLSETVETSGSGFGGRWPLPRRQGVKVSRDLNDPEHPTLPRPTIADIGTGSGVIAVALAHSLPQAVVYATDISDTTLRIARRNAERNSVIDRLFLLKGDLTVPLYDASLTHSLDAIISNPPYIPTGDIPNLSPEVRDYEPREALDGGPDGLRYYRRLIPDAVELLRERGIFGVEVGGKEQAQAVREIIEGIEKFQKIGIIKDVNGIDRVVIAYSI